MLCFGNVIKLYHTRTPNRIYYRNLLQIFISSLQSTKSWLVIYLWCSIQTRISNGWFSSGTNGVLSLKLENLYPPRLVIQGYCAQSFMAK
jgi:hypothetical protein